MKLILKVLFLILFFQHAFASEEVELRALRESAKTLIVNALQNGQESVEGVSLREMLKKIDTIPMAFMNGIRVREGSRRGGYYSPTDEFGSKAFVKLDKETLKETPADQIPGWMLHELAGAAGFPDRNYSKTLQIIYAGSKASANTPIREMTLKEQNTYSYSGTGTSVGGGGDPAAIYAKRIALDFFNSLGVQGIQEYENQKISRLVKIATICPFEFYEKAYAVQPIAMMRNFYTGGKTDKILQKAWAKLYLRRDWLVSPNDSYEHKKELIVGGVVALAKVGEHDFCEAPPQPYRFLSDSI